MDAPEHSSSDTNDKCKFCNEKKRTYTCPRCGIGYCSAECYKSEAHLDCSESFYKQCVEDELKSQELDPESRKQMLDILKRTHEQDFNIDLDGSDNEGSELDSDDDNDIPDLETRLQDIDLDNADEVWSALTESERQEFTSLLKNGEVEKLLPEWKPWWTYGKNKKLVEDLEATESSNDTEQYPAVIDVPACPAVQKASPNVKFNVANVIYAYAYMAQYYNGDYLSCPEDATIDFLSICENMKSSKVYEDSVSAFESVVENIGKCEWLPKDGQTILASKEAGNIIIQGPEKSNKSLYICMALSELHRMISATKNEMSKSKGNDSKSFRNKFAQRSDAEISNLSKKSLTLHCKKLEYCISWAKLNHTST